MAGEEGQREWSDAAIDALFGSIDRHETCVTPDKKFSEQEEIGTEATYVNLAPYAASDKDRALLRLGLRLRQVENQPGARQQIRDAIRDRWGETGLHLAEAIQAGIVELLIRELRASGKPELEVSKGAKLVFSNVENYVQFIRSTDTVTITATACVAIVRRTFPHAFVLVAGGSAVPTATRTAKAVQENLVQYTGRLEHISGNRMAWVFVYDPAGTRARELKEERAQAQKASKKKRTAKRRR